jgi:hypothetical protein
MPTRPRPARFALPLLAFLAGVLIAAVATTLMRPRDISPRDWSEQITATREQGEMVRLIPVVVEEDGRPVMVQEANGRK